MVPKNITSVFTELIFLSHRFDSRINERLCFVLCVFLKNIFALKIDCILVGSFFSGALFSTSIFPFSKSSFLISQVHETIDFTLIAASRIVKVYYHQNF